MKPNRSVVVTVLYVAIGAVVLVSAMLLYRPTRCWWHMSRYARSRDATSLYWILSNEVRSGMARNQVEDLLGTGLEETDDDDLRVLCRFILTQPSLYDAGVGADDIFVNYDFKDTNGDYRAHLQFRDNILVNHLSSEYAEWSSVPLMK